MSQFKKCKVVMLPTNEKAKFGNLVLAPLFQKLLIFEHQNCTEVSQHLYILSDEEIKEGDWVYNEISKEIYQFKENRVDYEKKIIATTDKSLTREIFGLGETAMCPLPQPSTSFIEKFVEEYNKGNVITEVMVEYEKYIGKNYVGEFTTEKDFDYKLKVNPKDNTITIRKVKDSWNRDEVRKLLITAYSKGRTNRLLRDFDEWLKENL